MTTLEQKFEREMFIDSLIELTRKYEKRLPAAIQCVSCVATAMRAGEDIHLAEFLKIFESSINRLNGKGKAHATAKP